MPQFAAYPDFASASRSVLEHLHRKFGFNLWMVTRTEGEDWIVLEAEDHGYGVASGDVFRWADSFCSRMVRGEGPCVASDSNLVASYRDAPIGNQVPIGAYIGIPLEDADGGLFGTLCAIDPLPKSELLEHELPMLKVIAKLLGSLLVAELKLAAGERLSELEQFQSLIDPLTNTFTPVAWHRIVEAEEDRCKRYAHPAHVICVRLADSTKDDVIKQAACVLRNLAKGDASVARVEETVFMMLTPEIGNDAGKELFESIQKQFATEGIAATFVEASRDPRHGLQAAIDCAEAT